MLGVNFKNFKVVRETKKSFLNFLVNKKVSKVERKFHIAPIFFVILRLIPRKGGENITLYPLFAI